MSIIEIEVTYKDVIQYYQHHCVEEEQTLTELNKWIQRITSNIKEGIILTCVSEQESVIFVQNSPDIVKIEFYWLEE